MKTNGLALTLLAGLAISMFAGCAADANDTADSSSEDLGSAPPLGADPSGSPARYAIVLAHGFNGSPTNEWAFWGVADALRQDGHVVHVAAVSPFDSAAVRGAELATHVDQAIEECKAVRGCDPSKVNVIAHSMGGLDSRYMISSLGYADRVASLTTISTPHGGSMIADVALKLIPGQADDAVNALARAFATTFTSDDLAAHTNLRAAFESIAESNAADFDAQNPDDDRVYYQSWAGVSNIFGVPNPKDSDACDGNFQTYHGHRHVMSAQLAVGAPFVAHGTDLRPNDGMVTVENAKHGTFRGCVPADHLAEVGQPKLNGVNKHTGFDHIRFYRDVAFDLAAQGY
jgi:triacylglycerol lipase